MNTTFEELRSWAGHDLVDSSGGKIGSISDLYLDERTQRPEWLAVSTGWFGSKISFVPLQGTRSDGDTLVSPWSKDEVKEAPPVEADGRLSEQEEEQLYRHYGLSYGDRSEMGAPAQVGGDGDGGDRSEARDDAMTRSEEELRARTEQHRAGTARLRKRVETEHVSERVPTRHEEARVEREPITEANVDRATSGPEISEAEHEVPLYEDEVVADTEVVPKERVRLDKEVVTDEEQVEANLRKEHIDVEGGDRGRRP